MNSKILSFILSLFLLTNCQDFLERPPLGAVTEVNFFQTERDAVLGTNAIYNTLRDWSLTGGFPIIDIMSDDMNKGSNPTDAPPVATFDNFTFDNNQDLILAMYATLYRGVRRANAVVERVPTIAMNNTLKNRLIAEARFLRAYFYFDLVRAFGDLPKVTTTLPNIKLARSPKSEIYNEIIIPDLLFASENLPEKSEYPNTELGRATKGAAKGLLARVYLFLGDFANTEKYALEVINSGQYTLDPDFQKEMGVEGEHGSGSIFEISAVSQTFDLGGNQYGNTQGVRTSPDKGWGFGRPAYNFLTFMGYQGSADPRLDASVIFLGEVLNGETLSGDSGTPDITYANPPTNTIIKEIECYNQKVFVPGQGPLSSFGHNRRVVRYADVLLMAAEALNQNNKAVQALPYLNLVRQRANNANPGSVPDITETSQATLRQIIWEERRRELAFEGHRFWDLIRTNRAITVLQPLGFVAGKHELLPIPQSEIDLSGGVLTQNPNW
jgi:starch-binding outer membrane protein, SusD/RagB family